MSWHLILFSFLKQFGFIIFWNYDENFKLYCYTEDGISYVIIKYIYKFLKTKKKQYILNRIETIYLIEYYENKYKNINIYLKCIKSNKIYTIRTIDKKHKIKLFFDLTEVDPPPPYEISSLIPYNYLDVDIPKLNIRFFDL